MNTQLFIRRPITTTLIMAAILIFGIFSYQLLPVSDLPNVDFPTIQVSASLPGASPDTMATAVATPLEKQFSTIAGVDSMTSTNTLGSTQITIQFTLSRNIDAAGQDVQAMIAKTQRDLPQNMPAPPSYQKVNPADQPVLYISMNSQTLRLSQVDEYAETTIAQQLSTVSGVAQVQVNGAQKYAVRAQLDPRAMATRKIGIDEVRSAIQSGNVNMPTGTLFGQHSAFTIQASGQLTDADRFRPLVIAYRNGSPVRLSDIGQITDSVENDKIAAWYTGTRAIVLAVQRQPGTNTVEVANRVKAKLDVLRKQIPPSVPLDILFDRTVSINESVRDVKFTLLLTICLVVMVIFLFLRNLSATFIPSLALPMSIVGTFSGMYLLGFSVDNLSLMALTLSVGFVVDDAIVMLENIVRHMEMGKTAYQAAIDGSREIGFTIISMTISLAAVFIPVIFMGGIIGRLLNEFAITIGVSILVSGFVSLTLTPMLCSRFLTHTSREEHGRFYRASEKVFDGALHLYESTLKVVMRHRLATFGVSMLVLVATVVLFRITPTGFLPNDDLGFLFTSTEAAQGVSFDEMYVKQQQIEKVIDSDPGVQATSSSVSGGNAGRIFMVLKPRKERDPAEVIMQRLRPQMAKVVGINGYMQMLPAIRLGGSLSKSQYQYTIQSADTDELYSAAPKLEAELAKLPMLQDVTSDLQVKNPQVNVDINRDQASALGVTAFQIEDALASAYGSQQISTIYQPTNQYRVIMELEPQYQRDPSALSMLYIRSAATGNLVPLSAVAN